MPLMGVLHSVSSEISLLSCLTCVMVHFTSLDIWLHTVPGCLFVRVFLDEINTWVVAWVGQVALLLWVVLIQSTEFFCCCSVTYLCLTLCDPWTTARHASLSFTISRSLFKPMSIELVMPPSHLILCCPLLFLPPIPPSIRVFSNESGLHIRWPKYWSFSFSISPSSEHPGLISFRMDWLDLLAVQGTIKSLLQHDSSKASILQHSAFFTVQHSHPCMTTGKTIALTRRTFVGKVMSLLFNMLSRLMDVY